MPLSPPLNGGGIISHKGVQQLLGADAEDQAVYGLELNRLVVQVDHLAQGVAGRFLRPPLRGDHALAALPTLLGCGKGVISVPHSKQQAVQVLFHPVFPGVQRLEHPILQLPGQQPAPDAPSPLHQGKIVELFHLPRPGGQGLDNHAVGVVHQEHHMRHFYGGVLPHRHPGGNAGHDGAFRTPDGGGRSRFVVVSL